MEREVPPSPQIALRGPRADVVPASLPPELPVLTASLVIRTHD